MLTLLFCAALVAWQIRFVLVMQYVVTPRLRGWLEGRYDVSIENFQFGNVLGRDGNAVGFLLHQRISFWQGLVWMIAIGVHITVLVAIGWVMVLCLG